MKLLLIFFAMIFCSGAYAAKLVKTDSDRTCVRGRGKLHCSPKVANQRSQNIAKTHMPKADAASSQKEKEQSPDPTEPNDAVSGN